MSSRLVHLELMSFPDHALEIMEAVLLCGADIDSAFQSQEKVLQKLEESILLI